MIIRICMMSPLLLQLLRKKTKTDVQVHTLKTSLTHDTRIYTCGKEIRMLDLEKKNRTGAQLLSGRQMLDMA